MWFLQSNLLEIGKNTIFAEYLGNTKYNTFGNTCSMSSESPPRNEHEQKEPTIGNLRI